MEHPWSQQGCTHLARKSELFPGELLPVEILWVTTYGPHPLACFGLWSPELGCGHSVCPVTGELARPGGQILLLPKENLEIIGGEPQSLCLCGFGGRFVNLASGFEAVNALEAVGKECGLGEGRGCWVCVSQCAILITTGHRNDNVYIIFCYHGSSALLLEFVSPSL